MKIKDVHHIGKIQNAWCIPSGHIASGIRPFCNLPTSAFYSNPSCKYLDSTQLYAPWRNGLSRINLCECKYRKPWPIHSFGFEKWAAFKTPNDKRFPSHRCMCLLRRFTPWAHLYYANACICTEKCLEGESRVWKKSLIHSFVRLILAYLICESVTKRQSPIAGDVTLCSWLEQAPRLMEFHSRFIIMKISRTHRLSIVLT